MLWIRLKGQVEILGTCHVDHRNRNVSVLFSSNLDYIFPLESVETRS